MNTYRKFNNSEPLAQFLIAVNNNSNIPFITATKAFPNHIPTFKNFIVTQESKDILRNYREVDVLNGMQFNNIQLPFIPDQNDIFAIFDTYTLQDNNNPRSVVNFNYFYNPTITNFMKLCRIKQYILNNKIVFTTDFVFVDTYVADMLRRIRYVVDVSDKVYTQSEIFVSAMPIIDSVTPDNMDDIVSMYGAELYDPACNGDNKIEVVVDDVTGDYDNESKIGNLTNWKNGITSFAKSTKARAKPVGRMAIYNGEILEESDSESDFTDSDVSETVDTYDYTYENTDKPFDDALRLQALWTIARDVTLLKRLMKTPDFKKWKRDHDTNMTNDEFMVAILRGQVPLNTDDVDGIVFFDTLDVIDFLNMYNIYNSNDGETLAEFNKSYSSPIVWDDNMPYEVAYPDVFEWIKDVLDLE